MSTPSTAQVKAQASRNGRRAANSKTLDGLARVGFVAKGLIYALVGVLAIQVAFGDQEKPDQQGALHAVAEQPFGAAVLWLVVAGLAGYALWRLAEATWGHQDESDERKRTLKRLVSLGDGVIYCAIGVLAFRTVTAGSGGGSGQQTMVSKVLDWPAGEALVFAVGAGIVIAGLALTVHGLRTDFEENLDTQAMGGSMFSVIRVVGLIGHAARGLVIALVGGLVIDAAVEHEPGKAGGLDVALKNVAGAPYGKPLLLLAAAGLIAYGVFCAIEARYRRLHPA
jgi:hypothetical protein